MPTTTTPRPYEVPCYRIMLVRDGSLPTERPQFRSSADVAPLFRAFLAGADREHFVVALLDRKNRLIGLNLVAVGSLTATIVHPRELFKAAILANASALVLCHNHPGSDVAPSREDRDITRRLVRAGDLMGIPILDHVILGDGTEAYFSFTDHHLLHEGA